MVGSAWQRNGGGAIASGIESPHTATHGGPEATRLPLSDVEGLAAPRIVLTSPELTLLSAPADRLDAT